MVVDDEEFCISAMRTMMELLGIDIKHQVDFCINTNEAVDKLVESYK
jgi:CheY-like chemotaxis protein